MRLINRLRLNRYTNCNEISHGHNLLLEVRKARLLVFKTLLLYKICILLQASQPKYSTYCLKQRCLVLWSIYHTLTAPTQSMYTSVVCTVVTCLCAWHILLLHTCSLERVFVFIWGLKCYSNRVTAIPVKNSFLNNVELLT